MSRRRTRSNWNEHEAPVTFFFTLYAEPLKAISDRFVMLGAYSPVLFFTVQDNYGRVWNRSNSVFYIQDGSVKLSVLSPPGKAQERI